MGRVYGVEWGAAQVQSGRRVVAHGVVQRSSLQPILLPSCPHRNLPTPQPANRPARASWRQGRRGAQSQNRPSALRRSQQTSACQSIQGWGRSTSLAPDHSTESPRKLPPAQLQPKRTVSWSVSVKTEDPQGGSPNKHRPAEDEGPTAAWPVQPRRSRRGVRLPLSPGWGATWHGCATWPRQGVGATSR